MKNVLLFVLFILPTIMNAQSDKDCEAILAKSIVLKKEDGEKVMDKLEDAFKEMIGCGIDSIDHELFFGGMIMSLRMKLPEGEIDEDGNVIITYAQLLKVFQAAHKNEDYQKMRRYYETSYALRDTPADIKNWEKDKELLKNIRTDETELNVIDEILNNHEGPPLTYEKFLNRYGSMIKLYARIEKDIMALANVDSTTENFYRLSRRQDYSSIYYRAKNQKKPVLLYLTGFASEKSREVEKVLLSDEQIWEIISEKYLFSPLFIDDNTPCSRLERRIPEFKDKRFRTFSERNYALQESKFEGKPPPCFAIVNAEEKVLGVFGYHLDKSVFSEFLKTGLDQK